MDCVETCEVENQQQSHAYDRNSRGNEFGGEKNSTFKECRRHDGSYKHDSRQQERSDKMAARNDRGKTVRSRNDDRSRHNSERSREVDKTKHEEHKRHTDIDKDARCSHSIDESRRFQDVKVKPEQRCRKTEDVKGKTHRDNDNRKCEESQNRHVGEKDGRCRETDKDGRTEEERMYNNTDRNITVKQKGEGEKRLITLGVHKCKDGKERCRGTVKEKSDRDVKGEAKKRRHSSPLAESRKKHKRSPSSDTEPSSTTSSCTESSGERSKARHKKRHKRLARKSKKKLKQSKKSRRRLRKDSDTESLSSDSCDSGSMSRNRNKKKRRWQDESSEEDSSNSEHEMKKKGKKKKKKVATKRKRKSSSSEDSETDDTSSDSEDQKLSRKHHKKVIKKSKKNHTKKKRKKRRSVQESESDESSCCNRRVCSSIHK